MFQNDYILRMIEMLGNLLLRLTELAEDKQKRDLLDSAARSRCGIPLRALENMSVEDLQNLLPEQARLLASELLYLKENTLSFPDEELLLKSLRLLISLPDDGPLCEIRAERVSELSERLFPLMTCEDYLLSASFLLKGLSFSSCEDAVFHAAEKSRPEELPSCLNCGKELLLSASRADPRDLALCGTSPEEMLEAAEDLYHQFS